MWWAENDRAWEMMRRESVRNMFKGPIERELRQACQKAETLEELKQAIVFVLDTVGAP
jgi:hypothetical protein